MSGQSIVTPPPSFQSVGAATPEDRARGVTTTLVEESVRSNGIMAALEARLIAAEAAVVALEAKMAAFAEAPLPDAPGTTYAQSEAQSVVVSLALIKAIAAG